MVRRLEKRVFREKERGSLLPQVVKAVTEGERPAIPSPLPEEGNGNLTGLDAFVHIMQRCWAERPEERPALSELLPELRWAGAGAPSLPLLVSCSCCHALLQQGPTCCACLRLYMLGCPLAGMQGPCPEGHAGEQGPGQKGAGVRRSA